MQLDYKKAQHLCSATELAVATAAKPAHLSKLSLQETRKLLKQSDKLSEKWREQAAKQSAAGESERAARSSAKAEIFTEVLARYQKQLERLEANPPSPATAPSPASPAPDNPASGKLRAPTRAEQARGRGRGADFRTDVSGLNNRVKGHVSARGKRSEAARAARNG